MLREAKKEIKMKMMKMKAVDKDKMYNALNNDLILNRI